MNIKLKDLRIAQQVLSKIDHPVPKELIIYLSQKIEQKESNSHQRRMARMTDEQLEHLDKKKCTRMRVHTPDGRFIQFRTNEETFMITLRELDKENLKAIDIKVGSKPLFYIDTTGQRKLLKGYKFLKDGVFVLKQIPGARRFDILRQIDSHFELGWDIEMI